MNTFVRLCIFCVSASVLLALAACQPATENGKAGTENDNRSEVNWDEANRVAVTLSDYAIDIPRELPKGPTIFRVKNNGGTVHSLVLVGQGIEKRLANDMVSGEEGALRALLEAGEYHVFCPIAQHAQRGMRERVVVTE